MSISDWMSIGSFLLVGAASIWGGLFRFSRLEHRVESLDHKIDSLADNLKRFEEKVEARFEKIDLRFEKIENKIESLRIDIHQHDIRFTKLEQRDKIA